MGYHLRDTASIRRGEAGDGELARRHLKVNVKVYPRHTNLQRYVRMLDTTFIYSHLSRHRQLLLMLLLSKDEKRRNNYMG